MDQQLLELEQDMSNYQKVKEIVLSKLVQEGLLEKDDANEFDERCQVLVYKGTWFSKWFDKNVNADSNRDKKNYYMKIVELKEKENEVDRLMRRTNGDYEE
jgi:predicted transcriptional regulator